MGRSGIRAAYATGRGKIKVRAKTEIVDLPNGKSQIVITEIPYMVNKARLVESMANLVKDKRIDGITNIQDHSSREGMQIVVDVRRDANAQVILNQLFTYSQLEDTISMIHIALVPGAGGKLQPRVLTLRQILDQYIGFQKDVVERRTRFDLKKARDRAHILEGLKVATDNIDRIIAIIRASKNEAEAKENLMAEPFWIDQIALLGIVDGSEHFEFHLDEPQAQAIVDSVWAACPVWSRRRSTTSTRTSRAALQALRKFCRAMRIFLLLLSRSCRRSSRNTATSAIRALRMWLTRSTLRTSSSSRTARTPSPTSAISSASRPRFTAHSAAAAAVFPQ